MGVSRASNRNGRLYGFTWAVIVLFGGAAATQAWLQVVARSNVLETARSTHRFTLSRTQFARRGAIYASDGRPLAIDQDAYVLGLNFDRCPKSDAFFIDLSHATGIPASDFEQLALSGSDRKVWHEALGPTQRAAVQQVKREWKADGVSLDHTGRRIYPLGADAANIVGMLMDDQIPLVGLEKSQNELLAGKNGVTIGPTDVTGEFLPMRVGAGSIPKRDGHDLTLTLDSDLQQEAANQIRMAVEKNQADDGVILVMNPETGDLLAMANYPTFDPTGGDVFTPPGQRKSTKNPAVQDSLEPGSMFKVLTLAKALNDGKIRPEDTINCTGEKVVWAGKAIHCDMHHGNRAHGVVDAEAAIAKSCNVSAATWALDIGYTPMVHYIEDLGLLKKTGVGLPYEARGLFRYDEYAKQLQLATVGFGQSITATPIGISSAFCMLANHGVQMKPRLIKSIDGRTLAPEVKGRPVTAAAADKTLEIMQAVIQDQHGTGFSLRIPGYVLAGKTGTAQRVGKAGGGYVSNFVGFVPSPNPKAMILVMVNHPKAGAYYGASVAGPVWEAMAKAVIKRYHIPPNDPSSLGTREQARMGGG